MSSRIAIAVVALAACEATGGGGGSGGAKVTESGTAKGSAAGFSAQMSAELAKAGVGEPAIPPVAPSPPPAAPAAGSAANAGTAPSEPVAAGTTTPAAGSGSTPATAEPVATGSAAPSVVSSTPIVAATDSKPAVTAVGAVKAPASRAYMKPSADIAAIKLELEPNWERDMGEAGTFSLVVKIPTTEDTRVFSVRYGYEDAAAPQDCDQYRKFLEDRGAMKVTLNRQRGAACYIEGSDQGGAIAYRFLLTYGGKRLMCHGSLYKDAASASLGDLRDKVLMQAKKICETLAL